MTLKWDNWIQSESNVPVKVQAYRAVIVEIPAVRLNLHVHSIVYTSFPKTKLSVQNAQESFISSIQFNRLQHLHLQLVSLNQKLKGFVPLLNSKAQLLVVFNNESDFFWLYPHILQSSKYFYLYIEVLIVPIPSPSWALRVKVWLNGLAFFVLGS